jgi:hypothetical protein
MRISIQKQVQTPENKAAGEDGEISTINQAEFETISQAKRFFYNIQIKYGKLAHQDYFSPEQGSASYYTEAKPDGEKEVTYIYFLDGFEGKLLDMITNKTASISKISTRDVEADIDYSKSADRDALALENLAKKLHEYLLSGQTDNAQLNDYKTEIMDIANDLNEVLGRINPVASEDLGDEYAGLGAGAKQRAGLTKEATSECRHCDFIARDPYELTDHQNEKHLGKKRKRTDRLKDVREQVRDEPRDAWSMGIVPYRERGNRW